MLTYTKMDRCTQLGCYKPANIKGYCFYHDAVQKEHNKQRRLKRQTTIQKMQNEIDSLKQQLVRCTQLKLPKK